MKPAGSRFIVQTYVGLAQRDRLWERTAFAHKWQRKDARRKRP